MRTYQETHPWITFKFDPDCLKPDDWRLLGEARSKCDHISGAPLPPFLQSVFQSTYLAKGINSTTAIEGNTLSESQVLDHIDGKLRLPKSQAYLQKEIENIQRAFNETAIETCYGTSTGLSSKKLRKMNLQILKGTRIEDCVVPGEIRDHAIRVGMYLGPAHEKCEYLLDRFCEWIDNLEIVGNEPVMTAIIQSIIAHVYLAWIHPFGDGNGRTARLVEHHILFRSGIPITATHLLSNHYNQTRQHYYANLENTSVKYTDLSERDPAGTNLQPFINYALHGMVDGLTEQLNHIREHQIQIVWINYVHGHFKDQNSSSMQRRKLLILEISNLSQRIKKSEIPNISRQVTEAYADRTDKTINRDINYLIEHELLLKDGQYLRANRNQIQSFLPVRAE